MADGTFKKCPPIKQTLRFRMKLWAIRFSASRFIALWLAPQIESGRRRFMRGRVITLSESISVREFSLEQKISAAIYIVAHGAEGGGISTCATLMSPMREFNLDDVDLEASRLLGGVMSALIAGVPQSQIDRLLQDQGERLSSDYVY